MHHRPLRPGTSTLVFCLVAAVAAVPIAFGVAAAGYGVAALDPPRDLAAIVLWSVAEEIVFRGAIQPAVARALKQAGAAWITPANALTSLLFSALHLWRHPLVVAASIFPVSLVYGRARELSGRVWPAALLHLTFNALLYAASWLRSAS